MAEVLSGQITVAAAGTEVQGSDVAGRGFYIKAKTTNTGLVYVGNDGAGAVSSTTGFALAAGDVIFIEVPNLNYLWFDSAVNGEGFCWLSVFSQVRL